MDNPFTWKESVDEEAVKDLAWWEEQKVIEKKGGFIVDPDEGIVSDPENDEEEEKLSDPNDCPRCRGEKRKVPPLCDSCIEEVEESDDETVAFYVANRAKCIHPYTIYKMSFMAEKDVEPCETCDGSGQVIHHNSIGSEITEDCPDCDDEEFECKYCDRAVDEEDHICNTCLSEQGTITANEQRIRDGLPPIPEGKACADDHNHPVRPSYIIGDHNHKLILSPSKWIIH